MMTLILNPTVELVTPAVKLTNEAKAGMETHPLTAETKIRKCSKQFKRCTLFYAFHRQFLIPSIFF